MLVDFLALVLGCVRREMISVTRLECFVVLQKCVAFPKGL